MWLDFIPIKLIWKQPGSGNLSLEFGKAGNWVFFRKVVFYQITEIRNYTYGVHLSLYSLASVSIPPPAAAAL